MCDNIDIDVINSIMSSLFANCLITKIILKEVTDLKDFI